MNIELICINQEELDCKECKGIDVDCKFYKNKYNVKYIPHEEILAKRRQGVEDERMGMLY